MPSRLGDAARVVDVLAGAAGALAVGRRAVVVELQRDADDVVALRASAAPPTTERIDAARHGDDDAGRLRPPEDRGSGHERDVQPRHREPAARSGTPGEL